MAKLYGELRASITRSESKPKVKLTEQTWTEAAIIHHSTIEGIPRWRGIILSAHTYANLKEKSIQTPINLIKIARFVNYRDDQDRLMSMFGWGRLPPKATKAWFNTYYDIPSIDEHINAKYEKDDIRLCTMQRSTPDQLIGIQFYYYRQDRFHYIKLLSDCKSTLAYRAGLRNFDRIISINGVNIEKYRPKRCTKRFKAQSHLPVQMLVCSPATYAHYKLNNMSLHENLPTIQRLRPVFDISSQSINANTQITAIPNESFCAVQWEESRTIFTVPQSAVLKPPEFTHVNDICFVEIEGQYRKGQIICIGSYCDCEKAQQSSNDIFTVENKMNGNQYIDEHIYTTLEQFPNELFFYLFNFIDAVNLYGAFWGINSRFNNLLQSFQNLSLIFDGNNNSSMMKLYASQIVGLTVDTSKICDFSQFPSLHRLVLYNRNPKHLAQIQPKILPNLTHLSFLLESDFKASSELICNVFSGKFPFLRYANLGYVDECNSRPWFKSPSLQFVSIHSDQPIKIVSSILASCPDLHHLHLHILYNSRVSSLMPPPSNHPLQRLTLWSDNFAPNFTLFDTLLTHTPNVQHLYLQTICHTPFVYLADSLLNRLYHVSRFDCYIKEMINSDDRVGNLSIVYQLHPCFNQIQCLEENDDFRIFATE